MKIKKEEPLKTETWSERERLVFRRVALGWSESRPGGRCTGLQLVLQADSSLHWRRRTNRLEKQTASAGPQNYHRPFPLHTQTSTHTRIHSLTHTCVYYTRDVKERWRERERESNTSAGI